MGKGLPAKYARMGFSKGWREYKADLRKGKVNKRRTTKRKVVGVKRMARRKYRRRYTPRRFRRAKPKIPLEVAVALGAIPFTPPTQGFSSIFESAQNGDFIGVADALKSGFLGMDGGRGTPNFDLFRALNPFDFGSARYVKMLIAAGIISKVRKSVVKVPFKKIPFIGKYIS